MTSLLLELDEALTLLCDGALVGDVLDGDASERDVAVTADDGLFSSNDLLLSSGEIDVFFFASCEEGVAWVSDELFSDWPSFFSILIFFWW